MSAELKVSVSGPLTLVWEAFSVYFFDFMEL